MIHNIMSSRLNDSLIFITQSRTRTARTTVVLQLSDRRHQLVLREQEQEVPAVHEHHDQRLVPHDHVVDGDRGQDGYGRDVHGAVSEQRPLVHSDRVAGGQAGTGRHAQRVVHAAAHHRAHPEVRLGQERSDDGHEQLGRTGGCGHERGPGHVW